jgi:hypothetical protein
MPAIKPRTTQKHVVRHITRLYRENNETLFAYAKFIGEPTEYVVNQLIATVLAKDRDFQSWLADNPGSHVPARGSRVSGRHRPFARTSRAEANATPVAVGSER